MSLYKKLVSRPNLQKAWYKLNKNPRSHGLDGITIKEFQQNLSKQIRFLQKELKENSFQFIPPRGYLANKTSGKKRPLKIPAIRDRVVCQGILNIIEKHFKALNYKCSFAYIAGRGREKAIAEVIKLRDKGFWYVLEADIKSFFDEVNQKLLLKSVFEKLPDDSLNALIIASLQSEIGNKSQFSPGELEYFPDGSVGIPQGGILSPLFSNVYLSGFDHAMLKNKFNLIRYADDFVVLCKTREEAMRAYGVAHEFLEKNLQLKIHGISEEPEAKTRITDFSQGFTFLGISFNHYSILPSRKTREKFENKISEITSTKTFGNLVQSLIKLKLTTAGWGNAYSFCHPENMRQNNNSMEAVYQKLDAKITSCVSKLLSYCDLLPKGKLRGFHKKVLGIPSVLEFLKGSPLCISTSSKLSKKACD